MKHSMRTGTATPTALPPSLKPLQCLTLRQPWATLIALGYKRFETRGWQPRTGEFPRALGIHAGATEDREMTRICRRNGLQLPDTLPKKAIVALAVMEAPLPTGSRLLEELLTSREKMLGDYSPGRYAWPLFGVQPLPEPVPVSGQRGLWTPDERTTAAIRDMLNNGV